MKGVFSYSILFSMVALLTISCSTQRKVIKEPLKEYGVDYLFENMKKHELQFTWLSAKFNAEAEINKKTTTIDGQIRILHDSVIWISISPALGIEVLRLYITNDSVKIINRLNSTYYKGTFKHLNALINTEVDFDMMQALLLGNDFTYYENGEIGKFKASVFNDQYILSTAERHKLKKHVRSQDQLNKVYLQNIHLSADSFKIKEQMVKEKTPQESNRKLEVVYKNFLTIGQQLFPQQLHFRIFDKEDPMVVVINYSKIAVDNELNLPFTIPASYTPMKQGHE